MGLISWLESYVGKSLKESKWILCANLRFTKKKKILTYVIMLRRDQVLLYI